MFAKKALGAAPAAVPLYIEDTFSTYLYTGNGSTQTITNNIDLSGEDGLLWIKRRDNANVGLLFDTERGNANYLIPSATDAQASTSPNYISAFNNNGFSLGNSFAETNSNGGTYASWTFRKAEKFFDVVTYTGDGVQGRTVNHNLGVTPGCIIIKRTDTTNSWHVWHRSVTSPNANWWRNYSLLNTTGAAADWGDNTGLSQSPTSTQLYVGNSSNINANGATYVAYLFAHDAGGFGDDSDQSVIKCGSADFSTTTDINLGWEPQWLMFKRTDSTSDWRIVDNMRGWPVSGNPQELYANLSSAESSNGGVNITNTGFSQVISAGTWIYIAIRRGPMKTPEAGTEVFYPLAIAQADSIDSTGVPFPPDLVNTFSRNGVSRTSNYSYFQFVDRLRGLGTPNNTYVNSAEGKGLVSSGTDAEYSSSPGTYVQLKADGINITRSAGWNSSNYGNWINYFFRRAPGFFDVVCWTGDGVNGRAITHNLTVSPELIIMKPRNTNGGGTGYWNAWVSSESSNGNLLDSNPFSSGYNRVTATSSTTFTVTNSVISNYSGATYVAYLFASVTGVSKVGTYTGNGSSQTINCGFTAGARFVLIKRTDSTGDWVVFDSARGIVSGNDPYLELNTTDAEVTDKDAVDTDNSGFVVNETTGPNVNTNGATYIYFSVA